MNHEFRYVDNIYLTGKQRSKREAELNTNRPNPGGHERKILTKLMNAEKNNQAAAAASGAHREKSSNWNVIKPLKIKNIEISKYAYKIN